MKIFCQLFHKAYERYFIWSYKSDINGSGASNFDGLIIFGDSRKIEKIVRALDFLKAKDGLKYQLLKDSFKIIGCGKMNLKFQVPCSIYFIRDIHFQVSENDVSPYLAAHLYSKSILASLAKRDKFIHFLNRKKFDDFYTRITKRTYKYLKWKKVTSDCIKNIPTSPTP